jgi:hypothetical protein
MRRKTHLVAAVIGMLHPIIDVNLGHTANEELRE